MGRKRLTLQLLVMTTASALWQAPAGAVARFGTHCQQSFQSDWQHSLGYTWERCSRFNNELDDTDTKVFYFDLYNKAYYWHDTGDHHALSLEDVDLFFTNTHGGISGDGNDASWTMWNNGQRAWSRQMRLGDELYGLSIFSSYACYTLRTWDSKLVTRWEPIMMGGLRYVTGSHNIVWNGYTTSEVGEEYADLLQHSQVIKNAWRDGLSDWWETQDLASMTTGFDSTYCHNRLNSMRWQNYNQYFRLTDVVNYYCWSQWTG